MKEHKQIKTSFNNKFFKHLKNKIYKEVKKRKNKM
jgi:hypothetical protein